MNTVNFFTSSKILLKLTEIIKPHPIEECLVFTVENEMKVNETSKQIHSRSKFISDAQ